jgi:hypothetical protein
MRVASRRRVAGYGYEAAPACLFADCLCHGAVLAKSQTALAISSRARNNDSLRWKAFCARTRRVNLTPMHDQDLVALTPYL